MGQSTFEAVVERVRELTSIEQLRLRRILDELLGQPAAPPTEDEFERAMVRSGLLSAPDRSKQLAADERTPPIETKGRPLSEIIIEERR